MVLIESMAYLFAQRVKKGLTLSEVAEKMQVSCVRVARMECLDIVPSFNMLNEYACALGLQAVISFKAVDCQWSWCEWRMFLVSSEKIITKFVAGPNAVTIVLDTAILEAANFKVDQSVKVSVQQVDSQLAIVLKRDESDELAQKYAVYHGTPETYQNPSDLYGWLE